MCLRPTEFLDDRPMKMVRLSALRTGRFHPRKDTSVLTSVRAQDHCAAAKIKMMKNPRDLIGNQTHHIPTCSAMSQPTAPLGTPCYVSQFDIQCCIFFINLSCKSIDMFFLLFAPATKNNGKPNPAGSEAYACCSNCI